MNKNVGDIVRITDKFDTANMPFDQGDLVRLQARMSRGDGGWAFAISSDLQSEVSERHGGRDRWFGEEWFEEPDPNDQDSYVLVDKSGHIDVWIYRPHNDTWWPVDWDTEDVHQVDADGDLDRVTFAGFDEGIAAIIGTYGIRGESRGDVTSDRSESTPIHPTVDFSGASRETARRYARDSRHRSLEDKHHETLFEVAEGGKVDVYDLREAATAALSAASNRGRSAVDRAEYAKKARHLIYIADAVIRNHADGLPVYAEGERSPKLEEAKAEIELLKADRRNARELAAQKIEEIIQLTDFREEVQAALTDAKEEIDLLAKALNERQDELAEARQALKSSIRTQESYRRTAAFAQKLLAQADGQRFADQMDGYFQALQDLGD